MVTNIQLDLPKVATTGGSSFSGGITGPQSTYSTVQNVLDMGQYKAIPPTLTDGQISDTQLDSRGNMRSADQFAPQYEDNVNAVAWISPKPLSTSTNAWSITSSPSTNFGPTGVNIKSSAGRVRRISVSNANIATGTWLQVHNKATFPVSTDVPVDRIFVPAMNSTAALPTQVIDYGVDGLYLGTGIGIAVSQVPGQLTVITTQDCSYCIEWL